MHSRSAERTGPVRCRAATSRPIRTFQQMKAIEADLLTTASTPQLVPEIADFGNDLFSGRKWAKLVLNDFRPV